MSLSGHSQGVVAISVVFLTLTYSLVAMRLYVRRFMIKKIDIDDYLLILTLACYTVYNGFAFRVATVRVFDKGVELEKPLSASLGGMSEGSKYYYLAELFYIISSAFLRTSVGFLLLRITSTRAHRIVIWVTMGLMIIYSLCFLFIVVFQCAPVQFFWNWTPGSPGKCNNHDTLANTGYAQVALSFLSDWTLGLMPVWLLWNVQISRARKIGISILLSFGLLCGVAALIRIYPIKLLLDTLDFWRDWAPLVDCSTIEVGLGIIAASLSTLRPLLATKRFQLWMELQRPVWAQQQRKDDPSYERNGTKYGGRRHTEDDGAGANKSANQSPDSGLAYQRVEF